jgi:hypothetical protein
VSLKGKSLYVLTPMYGGNLSMNYHDSFVQLVLLCQNLGIPFGWSNVFNESLISRARNRLTDSFMKTSANTHAIFIDADIGFNPQDIIDMLEMDKDILGVPCSKKSLRWDRIQLAIARRAFQWAQHNAPNGTDPMILAQRFRQSAAAIDPTVRPDSAGVPISEFSKIAGDFVMNFPAFEGEKTIQLDQPEEMKHVGTGLLMIKREVFVKFKKAYPDRWYEPRNDPNSNPGPIHDYFKVGINPETREYDSEDYWLCHDAIALGYKVLMAPWVRTTHMGTYTFVGDIPAALANSGEIF